MSEGCKLFRHFFLKMKLTYEYVKNKIEESGYKLLSKEYKNSYSSKLSVECTKGHQYKIRFSNFKQGHRCPICYGNYKLSYIYVESQLMKEGYKILSDNYENARSKLKIQCIKGHQYEVTYHNFQKGHRCPVCCCSKSFSQPEKDCLNVVKKFIPNENVIENDRTLIINPVTGWNLELDIWIPSLNKAIEFNGEYWHNNSYSKYKDNQKVKQCKDKGIELMVIEFKDWIGNKKDKIYDIKKFLLEDK